MLLWGLLWAVAAAGVLECMTLSRCAAACLLACSPAELQSSVSL